MASIAIDHIRESINTNDTGLAYIYCDYGKQLDYTSVNLFASLAKQLVSDTNLVPEDVQNCYEDHREKGTRPDLNEICQIFHKIVSSFSQVYLVLDALDKFSVTQQHRQTMLQRLCSLKAVCSVNLMITSRFIPEVAEELGNASYIEVRAREEDIRIYVEAHINDLARFLGRDPSLQSSIREAIVRVVDGM